MACKTLGRSKSRELQRRDDKVESSQETTCCDSSQSPKFTVISRRPRQLDQLHHHPQTRLLLYSSPWLSRFRLCFSFRMGIHTSPTTTNINPMDRQAEATERDGSFPPDEWSRKRRTPAANIRDPIMMLMMALWRKAQLGPAVRWSEHKR